LIDYDLYLEIDSGCSSDLLSENISRVTQDLKAVFGSASEIKVVTVTEIHPTASGKFLYTINKVTKQQESKD
jgi:hypothetical protein